MEFPLRSLAGLAHTSWPQAYANAIFLGIGLHLSTGIECPPSGLIPSSHILEDSAPDAVQNQPNDQVVNRPT